LRRLIENFLEKSSQKELARKSSQKELARKSSQKELARKKSFLGTFF
jgi:hypothetical protein